MARGMYRAVARYVVDGDTLDCLVDLGFMVYAYATVRVAGVDAPEVYHPSSPEERERGMRAKALVEGLLPPGRPVLLATAKDATTFGRYVAAVWYDLEPGPERWSLLADALLRAGLAEASGP
jgi:micrococcal nuclease